MVCFITYIQTFVLHEPLYLVHLGEVLEAMKGTCTVCMKDSVLTISDVVKTNEGQYRCVVRNDAGSVTSNPAKLSVCKSKAMRNRFKGGWTYVVLCARHWLVT